MKRLVAAAIAIVLSCAVTNGAVAESDGDHPTGGDGFHANTLGVFVGVTSKERRESAPTLGIEYERRLSASFGIGGIAEHASGDLDFNVFAIPFAYHVRHWKAYIAPGIEAPDDRGNEPLVRVGLEYGFELGNFEIAPQIDLDFVDSEQVIVFGVTFLAGF